MKVAAVMLWLILWAVLGLWAVMAPAEETSAPSRGYADTTR